MPATTRQMVGVSGWALAYSAPVAHLVWSLNILAADLPTARETLLDQLTWRLYEETRLIAGPYVRYDA
ncbi:MAG: hypothetical protein KKB13_26025 [Chloroflexi bacterium]|nr:hypothetical protein [Chloroflexota bacterium]MBU1879778.1 hypothetical protein [Chloroflexota bacterium]